MYSGALAFVVQLSCVSCCSHLLNFMEDRSGIAEMVALCDAPLCKVVYFCVVQELYIPLLLCILIVCLLILDLVPCCLWDRTEARLSPEQESFIACKCQRCCNLIRIRRIFSCCQARKPYTKTKPRERWTEEEHTKFLEAVQLYGRAWRKIEGEIAQHFLFRC